MRARSILLSPKYGVNPAIPTCFFCGEEKNEVILVGKIRGHEDLEAPRRAVWNMEPCAKCKSYMEMGIMLVSVEDDTDRRNPYRTGRICVIKKEAAEQIFNEPMKNNFAFVEDTMWKELGLPMENIDNRKETK